MDKDYMLHKWLNGEATLEEIDALKSSPEYADYFKIAENTAQLETPGIESDENFRAINLKKDNISLEDDSAKIKKLNPFTTFLKVAAVLIILAAGYVFLNSLSNSVETNIAQKENFELPDGSLVSLNAKSNVAYSKRDWDKNRALTLDGEAYFKVTKGNSFTVNTTLGNVTVLGTQFNVYARGNSFQVTCFEGLVSVAFNDTIIKLPAGEKITTENGKIIVHTQSITTSPNWIANESNFENATVEFVLEELKRQYPIKLTAQFSNVSRRFTGSFTHRDLNLALKSICDPLQLTYTIKEESVTIYAKEPK